MDKYEKEFYSCYCLFDVCCLAQAKEENFSKLEKRENLLCKEGLTKY